MEWEMQSRIIHIVQAKAPNRIICSMPDDVCLDSGQHTDPEMWANARLIVKAVNCHADLLKSLKEAQECLLSNGIDTGPLPGMSRRIRDAIAAAEKAQ